MKSVSLKNVIWAFDALEELEHHKNALFLLGAISRSTKARVEPVYVLAPPHADMAPIPPSDTEQAFAALGEKRLAEISATSDIPTMSTGKVLVSHEASMRKQVQYFIEYAKSREADAIVVATHARKGVERFFMGSFAETLVLYSDIPVFTVNPQAKVHERISKILFPTTFYPRFRPTFERAVELAKILEAKMTLLYKEPLVPLAMMSPELFVYIKEEEIERQATAKEWQLWAAQQGVQVEINIDSQPGYLAPAIAGVAGSEKYDLIAMGTQSDPSTTLLMGSTARQVIREATCPVWIMREPSQ